MSEKQVLQKEKVLTCGRGYRRAVLCYESGLVYQYDEPEKVLAQYVPSLKGWVELKRPSFNSSGWGHGSTGDVDGGHLMYNVSSLLMAINARIYTLNQKSWVTNKEVKEYNSKVAIQNKLVKKMSDKFNQSLNEYPILKPIEITETSRSKGTDKGTDVFQLIAKMKSGLNVFLSGKGRAVKVDSFVFSTFSVKQNNLIIAFRNLSGDIVMNSQVIRLTQFEIDFLGKESIVQNEIKKIAKIAVPFNVLEAAGLKLNETKIIEQGQDEKFTLQNQEKRHFTGSLVLENSGRKFFMDIDRIEIKHGIFNVFFVEVDSSVNTAAQAYESMKPDEVRTAENHGLKVLRQGEWFFIPTGETIEVFEHDIHSRSLDVNETKNRDNITIQKFNISHGKGRPNSIFKVVKYGTETDLVCGVVRHSGREHHDLQLGVICDAETNETARVESIHSHWGSIKISSRKIKLDLFKVIGNTTVSNFTITGDVD